MLILDPKSETNTVPASGDERLHVWHARTNAMIETIAGAFAAEQGFAPPAHRLASMSIAQCRNLMRAWSLVAAKV